MSSIVDPVLGAIDSILEWISGSLYQISGSYVELESADSRTTLVARDGSLVSIIKLGGARFLVGADEFQDIHSKLCNAFSSSLAHPGHSVQVMFSYDKDGVKDEISDYIAAARATAKRLTMDLDDLFNEKINFLSRYCAREGNYVVLWTRPTVLTSKQLAAAQKEKVERIKAHKIPPMKNAQALIAGIPELRDTHESFVRSIINDMNAMGLDAEVLDVYAAMYHVRCSVDPEFTHRDWQPRLPGDRIPTRELDHYKSADISDVMWPPLSRQLIPRDGENINQRTSRIGDRIYAPMFIELFPKDLQPFSVLFSRCLAAGIPWRISFQIDSDGMSAFGMGAAVASVLSFANSDNRLVADSKNLLQYIDTNTDDSVVKLRVMLSTWAPHDKPSLLRSRAAELAKALQGWGHCEVSEITGDPYGGALSSALALSSRSMAVPSIAPLSDVISMLPISRPSSTWDEGAVLFRSPDGKLWPFQPGSSKQTTWIDLIYARPGSGKSVLSNSINLGLCLLGGIQRLPRIAIIDIGPSSSGLVSLLKEALPPDKKHYVAYHRIRMTPEYSINPFDTQLGCRKPTPLERSFLVNFITLLATPIGADRPYDGITDMGGMIVDELYKELSDANNPNRYSREQCPDVDTVLDQLRYKVDQHTTWWDIVDFLFEQGRIRFASMAQRYAVPIIADAASICRSTVVEDLFGKIVAPTGEGLIQAFGRMISSAVREYPILARPTAFDLGEARVVSLDLDEVAKTGGEAADRQTAVMYMLGRYILAKDYYLTIENVTDMPEFYREYHRERIMEIREDPKRIVLDEFHRTSKAQAVRDQVIIDMREGRKWKVQVALLSQSLDDFDSVMVDFATAIYIMDAGPAQTVEQAAKVFGLSETAKYALKARVHGPRAGGGTMLALFSTKSGSNVQLITNTIGPVELWSFSTTAEDAKIRNALYDKIGPSNGRKILSIMYPGGSIAPVVEQRINAMKEDGTVDDDSSGGIVNELLAEILHEYNTNPMYRDQ